jgi:hypothetical protein
LHSHFAKEGPHDKDHAQRATRNAQRATRNAQRATRNSPSLSTALGFANRIAREPQHIVGKSVLTQAWGARAVAFVLTGTLALVASPAPAQTTAAIIHQSVHAQTPTDLYVPVPPQSLCKVHYEGASEDVYVGADDRGTILLHHWFPDKGMVMKISVSCTAEDGSGPVVSRTIEVGSVPDFEPAVSDTDYLALVPPIGKLIPALTGDPMSYSDKDLQALSQPTPRPDPVQSPGEYHNWLDLVTHARIIVSDRSTEIPGMRRNVAC